MKIAAEKYNHFLAQCDSCGEHGTPEMNWGHQTSEMVPPRTWYRVVLPGAHQGEWGNQFCPNPDFCSVNCLANWLFSKVLEDVA